MKAPLQFDFTINKADKTIRIKREFDANLELVWKAWTTAEILDQWWGPKPWRTETKTMDFREGGFWLYAMIGPEGERHWSRTDYISIVKEQSFKAKDGFCDENGVLHPDFPQNLWENTFIPNKNRVLVHMLLEFESLTDLEKIIEMGFQEGITMGLNQLHELLPALKAQNHAH